MRMATHVSEATVNDVSADLKQQFYGLRSFLLTGTPHLPVIVDPSPATGKANLVEPMMIAAVAAGADGLEVEVHYDPQHAWSDGAQCLTPDSFAQAMAKCRQVAWAIGRDM